MMVPTVVVLADRQTRADIESRQTATAVEWIWVDSLRSLVMMEGDAYFDLQFDVSPERLQILKQLDQRPLFVSSITMTCAELGNHIIRINAWPGMLLRPTIELAAGSDTALERAMTTMNLLGWPVAIAPDIPGFISGRILATIINEAFFTLESGVSTRNDIDIAMKLGTNYPYGPFEWAAIIGIEQVHQLLTAMSATDKRYKPCALLTNQRSNSIV